MSFLQNTALHLFKSNSALKGYATSVSQIYDTRSRRKAVKIAVIDDQPFTPQINLQNNGYKFDVIGDIKNISELSEYQLILCDIKGVGKFIGGANEGSVIIREIKNFHPEKIIIAYSASTTNDRSLGIAKSLADTFLKKDIDIDEWLEALDKWSLIAMDPHKIWIRIRSKLINLDIDSKSIMVLEDAYVRSILNNKRGNSVFVDAIKKENLTSDVRSILQGLASSAIYTFIAGSSQ